MEDPLQLALETGKNVHVQWNDELLLRTGGGLRVAIGAAHGDNAFRKPLSETGRADFFGVLPNLAARIAGEAVGGQTLFEGYPFLKPPRATIMGSTVSSANATVCLYRFSLV